MMAVDHLWTLRKHDDERSGALIARDDGSFEFRLSAKGVLMYSRTSSSRAEVMAVADSELSWRVSSGWAA